MKRNNMRSLKLAILAICSVALFSTTALAATWDAGPWKLSIGGNINAFYVGSISNKGDNETGGGTLTSLAYDGGKGNYDSSVSNGLLPASLNIGASTNQDGWDISAHVNVYYAINSNGADTLKVLDQEKTESGGSNALENSTVDARQVYMTFGKKDLGTFKLGRDFGIFGFDAIINDMTLLSVGAPFLAGNPGHTTLGGLGYGYIYCDRFAQMDYTTPNYAGFQATVGILQGFNGSAMKNADQPGFQGKVTYTWNGPVKVYASSSALFQKVKTNLGPNKNMWGWDGLVKASMAGVSVLGYGYYAKGMTSLAIGGLILPGFGTVGTSVKGEQTEGYMAQAMYTLGKVRFGANWGESTQSQIYRVDNQKITLGVFYNLTPALTLVAEYSHMSSKLKASNYQTNSGTDKAQSVDVGAILFF